MTLPCSTCGHPMADHCRVHTIPCCPGKCPDEKKRVDAEMAQATVSISVEDGEEMMTASVPVLRSQASAVFAAAIQELMKPPPPIAVITFPSDQMEKAVGAKLESIEPRSPWWKFW